MLGIRRTETPKATIMKIGFSGDVPYVVAVVGFCRCRLSGVSVPGPRKSGFSGSFCYGPYNIAHGYRLSM